MCAAPTVDSSNPDPKAPDSAARIERLNTALAEARRQLRAREQALERSESALYAIADGIVVTDLDGRITCLNPVAAHLSGWTEREALGRPLPDVIRVTDAGGRPVQLLADGFCNGRDDIVSLRRRDRHVILVDGAVAEVHGPGRKPIGYIVTFRNITAATRMNRELSYHADHDALTGLLNRRVFDAHLKRAVATAAQQGCRHALLYFDLDRFKAVNDGSGHAAGDELLRQLAMLLRRQLRDHDTLARLGGDEFAVLLQNCSDAQAATVAEKIRSAIAAFAFAWNGRDYSLGASIGLVEIADRRRSPREVIDAADRMCYVAKSRGRNRIAVQAANDKPGRGQDVSHRAGARDARPATSGRSQASAARS